MDEFGLIENYFKGAGPASADVILGIGDDTAILQLPANGKELLVTTDTLVSGVHFPPATAPRALGHKALAVNLSDIAAMGATPHWFTLALTLPVADAAWLEGFAAGLVRLAENSAVALVGGDTTRGPLSITVTVIGSAPAGKSVRRGGARPGDLVCVTGRLGGAALALAHRDDSRIGEGGMHYLRERLDYPLPRLAEGNRLRDHASAMIDVSDGLAADLGHILAASGVGASLDSARLPLAPVALDDNERLDCALFGGDDYELCCTLTAAEHARVMQAWDPAWAPLTVIGEIEAGPGLRLRTADDSTRPLETRGYRHFDDDD